MPPWLVLASGDFVYKGVMAVYWVLLARAMSIDGFAAIALANAIGMPAFIIIDAGLNAILVRDYSEAGGLPQNHRRRVIRRQVVAVASIPLLAALGWILGGDIETAAATGFISFAYLCDFFGQLLLAPSRAAARMEPDAMVRLIQAFGTVTITGAFILFDRRSPTWIALASAVTYLVALEPARRVWRASKGWGADPGSGHEETSDEAAVSQATILMSAFNRADSILVQVILGPAALAVYTVAYKLIEVARLLPGALSRVILAHSSGDGAASYSPRRHMRVGVGLSLLGSITIIALGPTVLRILFGAEYSEGSPVQIMGASIVPFAILTAGTMYAIGTGKGRLYRRIALESLIVLLVTIIVLAEWLGLEGAALGMLLSHVYSAGRFWRLAGLGATGAPARA